MTKMMDDTDQTPIILVVHEMQAQIPVKTRFFGSYHTGMCFAPPTAQSAHIRRGNGSIPNTQRPGEWFASQTCFSRHNEIAKYAKTSTRRDLDGRILGYCKSWWKMNIFFFREPLFVPTLPRGNESSDSGGQFRLRKTKGRTRSVLPLNRHQVIPYRDT
jgi:hypothetical protein